MIDAVSRELTSLANVIKVFDLLCLLGSPLSR